MNLKIINFGLLRPTFDALTIAKYKRWAKYTALGSSTAFVLVTGGLLAYKSRKSLESIPIPSHIVSYGASPLSRSLFSFLDKLPDAMIEDFSGAQSRCSGIDLFFQWIADIVGQTSEESRRALFTSYFSHFTTPLNFSDLRKLKTELLTQLHASVAPLFAPHLTRVPRDIDGKLVVNKDAGCSPPFLIDNDITGRQASVSSLHANGFVVLKDSIPITEIMDMRQNLNISESFSKTSIPFETRNVDLEKVFNNRTDGVQFIQLAPGRHMYRLRCTELESLVKPIHAPAMPVVWKYLHDQGDRVFLSEVSLVVGDALAGADSWHATNGAPGVVVIVPLTAYFPQNGNLSILPNSHTLWLNKLFPCLSSTLDNGGPIDCVADPGSILILDSRTMRMTGKNELFNKANVSLCFHYDFVDKPAPSQWITRTVWNNCLARAIVSLAKYYSWITSE